MGTLVDVAGPWSGWLPGPALCRECWLIVDGARSATADCMAKEVLVLVLALCRAGPCLEAAGSGAPGILGLVLVHWWAEPGSRVAGCRAGVLELMSTSGGWDHSQGSGVLSLVWAC